MLYRLKLAAGYCIKKRSPKKPVFILCHERTGSNLLISYLNSHPEASFADEVLCAAQAYGLGRYFVSKKDIFRHLRHTLNARKNTVCGAKIFFAHLERLKLPARELVGEFPSAKWIVLYRRDILSQFLSHQLALKTDIWIQIKGFPQGPDPGPLLLDVRKALNYRDKVRAYYKIAAEILDGRKNSFWLAYEDLTEAPQETLGAIFDFIGLTRQPVMTWLLKQNDRPLKEQVLNYEAAQECLEKEDFTLKISASRASEENSGRP